MTLKALKNAHKSISDVIEFVKKSESLDETLAFKTLCKIVG
jgi:hypothetical protein